MGENVVCSLDNFIYMDECLPKHTSFTIFASPVSPGTGDTDNCELPCGVWEWKPGPEEQVFLTSEPFL